MHGLPPPIAEDYTGRLGQLGHADPLTGQPHAWEMYSFNRAAYLFWNGFANHLRTLDMDDEQIKSILQSKHTRWLLDAEGDYLEGVGKYMAMRYVRDYREEFGPLA